MTPAHKIGASDFRSERTRYLQHEVFAHHEHVRIPAIGVVLPVAVLATGRLRGGGSSVRCKWQASYSDLRNSSVRPPCTDHSDRSYRSYSQPLPNLLAGGGSPGCRRDAPSRRLHGQACMDTPYCPIHLSPDEYPSGRLRKTRPRFRLDWASAPRARNGGGFRLLNECFAA